MIHTGITGKYTFKAPFDNINMDTIYISTSRVPIQEMDDNGLNPLVTIYTPVGLENSYDTDFMENVYVIGLQKIGGTEIFYVPEKYITGIPVNDGVKYVEKLLAFNIGLVPEDTDFTNVITAITDIISGELGINVDVKIINNSGITIIPKIDHEENLILRNNYLANNRPYSDLYYEALEKLEEKNRVIATINTGVKMAFSKK